MFLSVIYGGQIRSFMKQTIHNFQQLYFCFVLKCDLSFVFKLFHYYDQHLPSYVPSFRTVVVLVNSCKALPLPPVWLPNSLCRRVQWYTRDATYKCLRRRRYLVSYNKFQISNLKDASNCIQPNRLGSVNLFETIAESL